MLGPHKGVVMPSNDDSRSRNASPTRYGVAQRSLIAALPHISDSSGVRVLGQNDMCSMQITRLEAELSIFDEVVVSWHGTHRYRKVGNCSTVDESLFGGSPRPPPSRQQVGEGGRNGGEDCGSTDSATRRSSASPAAGRRIKTAPGCVSCSAECYAAMQTSQWTVSCSINTMRRRG